MRSFKQHINEQAKTKIPELITKLTNAKLDIH